MAGQKFPDSTGNGQGNSSNMALPCPQISSNVVDFVSIYSPNLVVDLALDHVF